MSATRSPLTYFGGKQRLAAEIDALMPRRRGYVETFAGGAAILFARPRVDREVLGDRDGAIVNLWRVVRDQPEDLARLVEMTPFGRQEWADAKAGVDDPTVSDVERARRFLVLVDQSFGRTCRSWSVPSMGRGRGRWQPASWLGMPDRIRDVVGRLAGVAIEHGDGVELIARYDTPEVTIYVDPPYPLETRHPRGIGYRVDDDGTLWPRLERTLLRIEHAAVAVSGYPCSITDRLESAGWEPSQLVARRGGGAREGVSLDLAPETLWRNPICVAESGQQAFEFAAPVPVQEQETR